MKTKRLYQILTMLTLVFGALMWTSCGGDENSESPESIANTKVRIQFVYTLDASNGSSMTRTSNQDVFNEFYEKIKSGDLVAPNFSLTLTEVTSGVVYNFNGRWFNNDMLTLPTGKYKVVGYSTADGSYTQEKCSFIFDEEIDVSITSNVITLHANYDCSLLIFNNQEIKTLDNYSGTTTTSFYNYRTYKYAFINDVLYDVNKRNESYIVGEYKNNSSFKIYTANLNLEKGKYFVYNSISNNFDVPPMEDGSSTQAISVSTFILDKVHQPFIVGGYINNFDESQVVQKGIIVGKQENDLIINKETQFDIAMSLKHTNYKYDTNSPVNTRFIDCTAINKEQFSCILTYLEGNTDYYVKAFATLNDNTIIYGSTETIHTKDFNRYSGKADYGNVYYAFKYTLFDLTSDEIIEPNDGFYYSTNENPQTVKHQVGTSYNTCYKFLTEWNYKLWYYHNTEHSKEAKMVNLPIITYSNGKVTISKSPLDKDKSIKIYYQIGGDIYRPEKFEKEYKESLSVSLGDIVSCYAISNEGYISYTNRYKIIY